MCIRGLQYLGARVGTNSLITALQIWSRKAPTGLSVNNYLIMFWWDVQVGNVIPLAGFSGTPKAAKLCMHEE